MLVLIVIVILFYFLFYFFLLDDPALELKARRQEGGQNHSLKNEKDAFPFFVDLNDSKTSHCEKRPVQRKICWL